MKELKTLNGRHTIEYYDSVEMPMERYHRFNTAVIIGSGTATDVASIMGKIAGISELVGDGHTQKALLELKNLSMSFAMMSGGLDPRSEAFACLVHKIDDVVYDDLTDDGIRKVRSVLDRVVGVDDCKAIVDSVKKK